MDTSWYTIVGEKDWVFCIWRKERLGDLTMGALRGERKLACFNSIRQVVNECQVLQRCAVLVSCWGALGDQRRHCGTARYEDGVALPTGLSVMIFRLPCTKDSCAWASERTPTGHLVTLIRGPLVAVIELTEVSLYGTWLTSSIKRK